MTGAGVVGAVGCVVPVGIVTIGALEDVLPPPPQDESNIHAASALKRRSFTTPPRTNIADHFPANTLEI